jgi:hypothetical protein
MPINPLPGQHDITSDEFNLQFKFTPSNILLNGKFLKTNAQKQVHTTPITDPSKQSLTTLVLKTVYPG